MKIPPVNIYLPQEEMENIKKNIKLVLKRGQLTMGRFVEAFDAKFGI